MGKRAQGPKEIGDIDTDDEKDEEAKYEQWKSRELRRIRRARWLQYAVPQLFVYNYHENRMPTS